MVFRGFLKFLIFPSSIKALKKLAAKFLMEKARYNVARELLKQVSISWPL